MGEYRKIYAAFAKDRNFYRIKRFSEKKKTPFLVLDIKKVRKNYDDLKRHLSFAQIYYAVKANPHPAVLSALNKKGANFDVASTPELKQLLNIDVSPERISFGNTIKKSEDIKYFYQKGVRMFATDSLSDLRKIAANAKGSKVFFRLLVDGSGSDWPLSKKFGAHQDVIQQLAMEAKKLHLVPYGLSFHVGSQQRDVEQWDQAIAQCKYIFECLAREGIDLQMINLGGGFPSEYLESTHSIEYYCSRIKKYLNTHFGRKKPKILIEPGRYMVGNSGVLVTEVVLINKKAKSLSYSWLYLDAGIYNGLDECLNEAIAYPILTDARDSKERQFVLAGPTCDSQDILYEKRKYSFPANLEEGDRLYFLSAGAYTFQVSTVAFNGFPPLKVYVLE